MKFPVTIMSFSGVCNLEDFARNNKFKWIDCRKFTGTNCYCEYENVEKIKSLLQLLWKSYDYNRI